MNLLDRLYQQKIDSLGYDTVYTELPVSNIIDFDWKNILNKPPSNTDKSTIRELEIVSKATLNRSKSQIDIIHSIDQELDQPFIKLLNKYKLKYPQNYIDLFYDIVRPVLKNTKSYWNRPRPNQLAKIYNIKIDLIITDTIHSGSYPSGHVVYSSLVANILKDTYPEIKIEELDSLVDQTAKARIMQGVHYPSDAEASKIFTKFLFNKLNSKLRKYNDSI